MSDDNNVSTAEPARRGRPRKADAPKRASATELKARINFAAVALRRALKDNATAPSAELVRLALDTLAGEQAEG